MTTDLFTRYRVIDTDTHVTEPTDLWTARVFAKWGDRIPHIERLGDEDVWRVALDEWGASSSPSPQIEVFGLSDRGRGRHRYRNRGQHHGLRPRAT